jgi:hypothetical protein
MTFRSFRYFAKKYAVTESEEAAEETRGAAQE